MHDHEHEHDHPHDHEHTHHHELPEPRTADELSHILGYMFRHNESHTEELERLLPAVSGLISEDAAQKLRGAIEKYKEGNALLEGVK